MMTAEADFGFSSKKKLTTYGRAGRGFGALNSPGGLPKKESSTLPVKAGTSVVQAPSEATNRNEVQQIGSQQNRRNNSRQNVSGLTAERGSTPSAKKASTKSVEEDAPRAKKRKIGTTSSSDNADVPDIYDIYSPPTSPRLVASPKKSPRPNGSSQPATALGRRGAGATADSPVKKDFYDLDQLDTPTTSKTSKALRGLSIDNATPEKAQNIPVRLTKKKSPRPSAPLSRPAEPPARKAQPTKLTVPTRRGKRLIDALAAQGEDSSEEEQMPSQQMTQQTTVATRSISPMAVLDSSPPSSLTEQSQSLSQSQPQSQARALPRQISMASRRPGPKFTYSQQRTMLAEESLVDIATFGDEDESQRKPAFLGLGNMNATSNLGASSFVDDEDDTANTGAVQSLHELRQAGANSRFSDEMSDILDRIGSPAAKPSSLRRGALLELAEKIKQADFRRQFRNHSNNGELFKGLAEEVDLVAGFAIVSIITTLLATSLSQHLILQIRSEGISHLLLLLLDQSSDISVIARDRKRNVSKNAQATLSAIKSAILKLSIWEPASPTLLSPRTLALKALDLLMRHLTGSAAEPEVFSAALTDRLFDVVSNYANPSCWDFPAQHEALDFYLALHLLENHSVSAMQSSSGARWATEYLPTVAGILGVALQRPVDKFDDLETSTLKLTLNMTNNNHETPAMFVNQGLLRDLAEAACRTFDVVNKSIKDDAFLSKVYDSLILMLGVKINFCEHYSPAAQDLMDAGDGQASPLNRLIRVFLDYHSVHADVSRPLATCRQAWLLTL